MFIMNIALLYLLLLACTTYADGRKNVLFIMSDDLRPDLGVYQDPGDSPKMVTPHLDAFAEESLVFKRAYTQQAVCNPSRSSMLTGRRPDTTKVYTGSTYWRNVGGNFTTLPQYFKENNYISVGMGKIYHISKTAGINNDPLSWSEPFYTSPSLTDYWAKKRRISEKSWRSLSDDFLANESPHPDGELADYAIETLQRLAPEAKTGEKPFFLAVGFKMPHLPFMAPEKYFSLYPDEEISLPANPYVPINMPSYALSTPTELMAYGDIAELTYTGEVNTTLPNDVTKALRRAYFAAVSYVDDLVGKLLSELQAQNLDQDTIVVFVSDHGYELGEHSAWTKNDNFELSTRVPLMIRVPGVTDSGLETSHLVELVDLFPTLVDLADLPQVDQCPQMSSELLLCSEGSSMLPLFSDPLTVKGWKQAAFSQYLRGSSVMGYSVRTDHYRYTEWVKFNRKTSTSNFKQLYAIELYDHRMNSEENVNIADSANPSTVQSLSATLQTGWLGNLPTVSSTRLQEEKKGDAELEQEDYLQKLIKILKRILSE